MNIGFISTRLAGTDGVTLETIKWARICRDLGHSTFFCAGQLDPKIIPGVLLPEAHFTHPEIVALHQKCFGVHTRLGETTEQLHELRGRIKTGLAGFVKKFAIDLLVPQNVLTIPMNLPLGMALTEFIAETGIHAIAHHHDFYWERQRFMINAVQDILDAAFPPSLPSIKHVVINTPARRELAQRKGIAASLIPNVFDFDTEPPAMDEYARDLREQIGLKPDDILILQPTRLVSRKGVEHAIELVRRLKEPRAKLVVSHSAGDEGLAYYNWLRELAQSEGVDIRFMANRFSETRSFDEKGQKIYTLWDIYPHADIVTYPSIYEGFGNAFLEAIYFRKPIVVNRYSVYMLDIEPLGFETVTMDGYVTDDVVEKVRHVLNDPELRKQMADRNFTIARQHFSLTVLKRRLHNLIESAEHTPPGEFPQ
ncbi:MAG TPA: glycosyltransferase family 4 protein [Verrucomicrobiae bacterium]|nr:glycosyltransferase family 4 protein [Verrucomicrobiae bacterium]